MLQRFALFSKSRKLLKGLLRKPFRSFLVMQAGFIISDRDIARSWQDFLKFGCLSKSCR